MQPCADAAMIDGDPHDEDQHHRCDQRVGRDDERCVGTKRHHGSATGFEACSICSARRRRRRISLRMAARCSVMNSSENATAITSRGIRNDLSSDEPPIFITDAG